MYEFTPVGWLKHCVFHPVEGFEDLRWKKQGSMKISMLIVLFLFIAMVVDRQLTGFQFNDSYVKVFNVVPLIVQSVVYFFTWVLGNWAICTLLDGEARLAKEGENLHTLDDSSRLAKGTELVIADAEHPAGLAGIMGGLETEVTEKTTTVVLEAASFNGPSIRRTSYC